MNKVIYIGQVPQQYLDEFGDEGQYFEFNDKKFYYALEFNVEEGTATLIDTCNRSMPMDYTNYDEIAFAMGEIAEVQKEYQDIQDEMEEFLDLVPEASYVREVTEKQEDSCYSAAGMASAAAQGFRGGRAFR